MRKKDAGSDDIHRPEDGAIGRPISITASVARDKVGAGERGGGCTGVDKHQERTVTDLFQITDERTESVISAVAKRIAEGNLTKKTLFEHMTKLSGRSSADGGWSQRDAYDLLEAGLTRHLIERKGEAALGDIPQIAELVNSLPTHTVRSEDQIKFQQFSTPADLAALATILSQPTHSDIVLEPSAGHGSLVAYLPRVQALHLNELDAKRRAKLKLLFPSAMISGFDGAMLDSAADHALRPTLILMNPPFSRSYGRGVDQYAAVRHLRAAITKLATGGRLVAIMPDWFAPGAKLGKIYDESFNNCTVQTSCRLEQCYTKQGTTVAVRLYVVDKLPGNIKPTVIARKTTVELAQVVGIVKRAAFKSETDQRTAPKKPSTLFRAMRTKPRKRVAVKQTHLERKSVAVAYETLSVPRALGTQAGVYVAYRPSRIDILGASQHPTPLVESVAMGSIPAPVPEYVPNLHDRILNTSRLSEAQLETVIYAGNAWLQYLPGKFVPAEEGVGLTLSEEGRAHRKGYFLGDGTGAGKGRQIAACILDNWLAGRRQAIWVSKNENLLEDARRDWAAIGGLPADIQPLSNWTIDEALPYREGIVFVTYPTLRSQRQDATRLKQLLDWAGPDYEGVIAFDESHEMGGVAGGEGARGAKAGSLQGIAGVLLQNHLPDARVLYASATGASDVNNLAYAVRLGLWGPGTAFSNREDFIGQIRSGGIAAMELVSRDLKALGLYQARALSFAGVEYEVLKHDLTDDQIRIYDTYADAWAIIHQNMEEALALTNVVDELEGNTLNSGAKAAARSRFEGAKQRFFNQVLLSMKLPTLIAAINAHIDDGKAIVVQLVSTAESILDRRLNSLSPEERAEPDIDLSPRENVIDYLERAFPTQQMQVFVDDTGEERSMPMFDDEGRPVHNALAIEKKQRLIEHLCALPPIKPALDGIIEHYGTEKVAEVTGRTKRLITQRDASQKLETRSARTNQSETDHFMDGRKSILVFSDAGGTGRSYHASLDAENQRQRVHFLLEPGWRADRAIQGLGRTHRTHQAATPLFRPVTTDCKGELRFTSTIARRLDSLGALTRGQRQTGGQNLFDPADNLESEYAKAALVTWLGLLVEGKLKSATLLDFQKRTGLRIASADGILEEDLPPIQRWLNRILALPIAMQNAIFEEFLALVEARVSAAREAGTLDLGVDVVAPN
ncbi:strawberry notch family protein [Erythrobacteraceae bacterium E2-1 Yellow Sea]|nr:strawberry notch family protein [Erythrobacteraceae bacterium E2-1 Yellow Sea]